MSDDLVTKCRRKLLRKRKKREFDKKQKQESNGSTDIANGSGDHPEYVPLKKRRMDLSNQIAKSQKSIRSAQEAQEKLRRQQQIKRAMGGRDTRSLIDQHQELVRKGIVFSDTLLFRL